jgi:hypothetical protein
MIRKLSISAMALAAFGMAAPAMAQQNLTGNGSTVDINIEVESIAILEVLNPTGTMVIDNDFDNVMGNSTSDLPNQGASNRLSDYAQIRLMTNFQLSSLDISFPMTNNIRNLDADPTGNTTFNGLPCCEYFAAAAGPGGATLGVFPVVYNSDGFTDENATGFVYQNNSATAGNTVSNQGSRDASTPAPWIIPTPPMGLTDYAIGVSTNWGRTKLGEPLFAAPGTYTVTMTATMIP